MTPNVSPDIKAMDRDELERFAGRADHDARNWEQQYRLVKNESGPFAGMPWQIRALAWLGLPVAILALQFAQDAGLVPSLVRSSHANALATNAAITSHITKTDEMFARVVLALRISCENAARDQAARNNCSNIR